jgi:uncharacterized membrane protein YhaH (DUF805 family)
VSQTAWGVGGIVAGVWLMLCVEGVALLYRRWRDRED